MLWESLPGKECLSHQSRGGEAWLVASARKKKNPVHYRQKTRSEKKKKSISSPVGGKKKALIFSLFGASKRECSRREGGGV